ncbi:hypothetical protein PPL_02166 [Heterostelium album PN500]|uniref:Uncharacterized protein n=1 Tax=Heterostelium pallidum (strain ATCC 26659 / Pp 5 / PN500) TaxID=670386 RepID=D3B1J2_HETP5|nr:hypothetical protein PPL_02166 [Heterostelium album PN500]EFA85166.1 hypothetical protein PPL_02166 [Heterostelium album PN500]|eukprot:XP_020437275.1 hypothetical protein PPL_02166 [Heterostelium album PN500]
MEEPMNNTTTTSTTNNNNNEQNNSNNVIEQTELEIKDTKDSQTSSDVQKQQDVSTTTSSTKLNEDEYEEIEGYRYMLIIDSDDSTARAFDQILKVFDKDKDEFYLLTVTSSLDYLNDEKNNAKLALFKYQNYLDIKHIDYIPINAESLNISSQIVSEIEENEIDIVYIGAQALSKDANPDNMLFTFFSFIKKTVLGTIVYGLERSSRGAKWKLNH